MGDRVSLAAPFLAPESVVRDEWLDANGHMNLAYYVVVFDHATDALLEAIDLGDDYRRRDGGAVFAVETHTLYRHELRAGERVRVATRLLGADAKRLHLAHEMLHPAHGRVAMQELMFLHVDVATRRAAAFPPDAAARLTEAVAAHASLPRPDWVGRRIALPA